MQLGRIGAGGAVRRKVYGALPCRPADDSPGGWRRQPGAYECDPVPRLERSSVVCRDVERTVQILGQRLGVLRFAHRASVPCGSTGLSFPQVMSAASTLPEAGLSFPQVMSAASTLPGSFERPTRWPPAIRRRRGRPVGTGRAARRGRSASRTNTNGRAGPACSTREGIVLPAARVLSFPQVVSGGYCPSRRSCQRRVRFGGPSSDRPGGRRRSGDDEDVP